MVVPYSRRGCRHSLCRMCVVFARVFSSVLCDELTQCGARRLLSAGSAIVGCGHSHGSWLQCCALWNRSRYGSILSPLLLLLFITPDHATFVSAALARSSNAARAYGIVTVIFSFILALAALLTGLEVPVMQAALDSVTEPLCRSRTSNMVQVATAHALLYSTRQRVRPHFNPSSDPLVAFSQRSPVF